MQHKRRLDLLSGHVEPDPDRELADTTHPDHEEYDGDMIDLDDFEDWSQPSPLSSPMPAFGRSTQDRGTAATAELGSNSLEDEDDDDAIHFEEYDDFSTTKTSSDRFVRYSEDPDTPPINSAAIMGDAGGQGLALNLNLSGQQENLTGSENDSQLREDSLDSDDAARVDSTSNDEHLPDLESNSETSSEIKQDSGDSGDSDSTVRARTIVYSEVGAGDSLAAERQNDFDLEDEPSIQFEENFEGEHQTTGSSPTVLRVQVDFDYDSDDEATTQFIEDIADPAAPSVLTAHPNANSGVRQALESSGPAVDQHYNDSIEVITGYLDNGVVPSSARSFKSYGIEATVPVALSAIKEGISAVLNRSSSNSTTSIESTEATGPTRMSEETNVSNRDSHHQQQQRLEERVKDTRTGFWIALPRTLVEKKETVLAIFLHHTTRLFATTLCITYTNVFMPNSPIPYVIWSRLFKSHEAARLFEAQNQKLHASAVARTKTLLEEWRISSGFPRVPEAYKVKERVVSYTYKHSERERAIARNLLHNRTVKTETWVRRIFDLGRSEIDDGMYGAMVESVLELVSEIYECPMGVVDEHLIVKNARKELRSAVVDELGILLEGLRLS